MKTSSKLLVVTILIGLSFLVIYDLALRSVYKKGEYKSRFYQMERLSLNDFDAIKLDPPTYTKLTIEQGPNFAVWVNEQAKNEMIITKQNKILNINYKKGHEFYSEKNIIIICPSLKSIVTKPQKNVYGFNDAAEISVSHFHQDTMNIQIGRSTLLNFNQNTVTQLNAGTDTSGGKLNILPFNHIKYCNLNMQGLGELRLYDKPGIKKANYKLSKAAILTLSNDALGLFSH